MSIIPYEKMIDDVLLSLSIDVSEEQKQIIMRNVSNVNQIVRTINGDFP